MESSVITFIINGKTYRIAASDSDAIRQISKQDRGQLIDLLEAVKLQDRLAATAVQQAAIKVGAIDAGITPNTIPNGQQVKPERLGSGDVDELMARLIMEEKNKNKQKPALTQKVIYVWAAVIIGVIFLLVLLF